MNEILAGAALIANKDLLNKLLGPSLDYIGNEIIKEKLVKKSCENISSIFSKACKKLGDKLETPGTVNPRILQTVLVNGSFCEDDMVQEYLAGALAIARTDDGKDDSVIGILKLIETLSHSDLRLHYILYSALYEKFKNSSTIIYENSDLYNHSIFIPFSELYSVSDIEIYSEILTFLDCKQLISYYGFNCENPVKVDNFKSKMPGLWFTPTLLGIKLFLTLHSSDIASVNIFNADLNIKTEINFNLENIETPFYDKNKK